MIPTSPEGLASERGSPVGIPSSRGQGSGRLEWDLKLEIPPVLVATASKEYDVHEGMGMDMF